MVSGNYSLNSARVANMNQPIVRDMFTGMLHHRFRGVDVEPLVIKAMHSLEINMISSELTHTCFATVTCMLADGVFITGRSDSHRADYALSRDFTTSSHSYEVTLISDLVDKTFDKFLIINSNYVPTTQGGMAYTNLP